jgi:4-amino-4-deoxychorismate mutase
MNSKQRNPSSGSTTAAASGDASSTPGCGNGNAERILQQLRDELDGLDRTLLEALQRRLDCCCRIGLHKRDHAIPMMQPQRIGVVQARAAAFAAEHGVSPAFLRSLYELIIAETCRLEDEIISEPPTSA